MSKNKEVVKARFIERFLAFIIDMLIVSIASSLLSYPFISSTSRENQEKLAVYKEYKEKDEKVFRRRDPRVRAEPLGAD